MLNARKSLLFLAVLGVLFFPAAAALADWDPDDEHKMHHPQLPDPQGWDVAWCNGWLGDDWQCSESGPVSDIHLWVSFYGYDDNVPPPVGNLAVQIWTNSPVGPGGYSIPDELKWEGFFTPADFTIRHYGFGDQGWFWPVDGIDPAGAHASYFQINIDKIVDPFYQKEGEIYWLVTKFDETNPYVGWKTTLPDLQFMDDAVYYYEDEWNELWIAGESRDLAFVITPEPGTILLLITGGLGLLFAWRRRRK